jgi:hypothetical protein
MKYTVRYCHLDKLPDHLKEGQLIKNTEKIGVMGNTGASTGRHLHIDCVQGFEFYHWHLKDMVNEDLKPNFKQLLYFIDNELFNAPFEVTSHIYDYRYYELFGKHHPAIDIIPLSGDGSIFWNRSKPGQILSMDFDSGYGNYIHMGFYA